MYKEGEGLINSYFTYDPQRIKVCKLDILLEKPDEYEHEKIDYVCGNYQSWTQIDDDTFARPFLREVKNLPLIDGVKILTNPSVDGYLVDTIECNDLLAYVEDFPFNDNDHLLNLMPHMDNQDVASEILANPEKVAVIDIERASDSTSSTSSPSEKFLGKDRDFIRKYSKLSFKSDIEHIGEKLKMLGYRMIVTSI